MEQQSERVTGNALAQPRSTTAMNRRTFIGTAALGAAGLATTSVGAEILAPTEVAARVRSSEQFPGLRPTSVPGMGRFPKYRQNWTNVPRNPFGGYDFALGYMAEGVQGIDPESPTFPNGQFSNTSGLFEHFSLRGEATAPIAADTGQPLGPVPSGVGGNETPARSAEFWSRDILGQSNETIRDDMWSAINWMRRVWGLDFDDPAADGLEVFGYPYQFPGSPDADNDYSLFRLAMRWRSTRTEPSAGSPASPRRCWHRTPHTR